MNSSKVEMGKKAGFTLVEVMIVIAVFAIMAAVAIPAFMSLLPGMRLNGATRQVAGDLMAARMNAVKVNKDTQVIFDDDNDKYQVWYDEDGDGNKDLITEKYIQTNYHDVTVSSNNNPIFHPRGTATNLPTITLLSTSGAGSKRITISIAGRVKIN
jgi:type IV fimbrial biogenesis protein FimT